MKTKTYLLIFFLSVVTVLKVSAGYSQGLPSDADIINEHKTTAKRLFRDFYGCKLNEFDDLVSEDFRISYPIFETIQGKPVIEGREAVKNFAEGFCQRWADPEVTIHEVLANDETAVLLWSYSARNMMTNPNGASASGQRQSWGGITFYRFNRDGKIVAEFGEESDPGPASRIGYPLTSPDNHESAMSGAHASGTYSPKGPPEHPVRIDAGNNCIVDLKEPYSINGTLSGSMEIDYRILVHGPCGKPIGTFDEEWIAHGTFNGTVNDKTVSSVPFSYTANVQAGGDVDGLIIFSGGLAGKLTVGGNFGDGHLNYSGSVK